MSVQVSSQEQGEAKACTECYARREDGTVPGGTTEDDLWRAKRLYESSHHPETGEKIFILGRMSFQAPGNMVITGLMNTYRR